MGSGGEGREIRDDDLEKLNEGVNSFFLMESGSFKVKLIWGLKIIYIGGVEQFDYPIKYFGQELFYLKLISKIVFQDFHISFIWSLYSHPTVILQPPLHN